MIGKCPRCRSPFEKNGGCPLMTCTVCQLSYCWVCGLEDGLCHNLFGGPIMCSFFTILQTLNCFLSFILQILLFIFLPVLVLIAAGSGAVYLHGACLASLCRQMNRTIFGSFCWCCCMLPWSIVTCVIMFALFFALGLPFAYLSFIFFCFRKVCCMWNPFSCCCKPKRRKHSKAKIINDAEELVEELVLEDIETGLI
jgi:hypothetical protein